MRASEQQKSDASKSFQQDALGGIPGLYPPGNPTEATSYPFCGSTLLMAVQLLAACVSLRLYCQGWLWSVIDHGNLGTGANLLDGSPCPPWRPKPWDLAASPDALRPAEGFLVPLSEPVSEGCVSEVCSAKTPALRGEQVGKCCVTMSL